MNITQLNDAQSLLALTQVQAANANLNNSIDDSGDELKVKTDSFAKSEAFPLASGLYTSSGQEAGAIKAVDSSNESEQAGTKPAGGAGGMGGGSSGDDDSETETSTQIITINGVTYLETTTTSNGVETVTRKVLSSGKA